MIKNKTLVIYQLMKFSKKGDRKAFFDLAESSQIFYNLKHLTSIEASKLIYSFSNLKISDPSIWGILENLFLVNSKNMNMHDYIMCTWAFQKFSKNPEVWSKIEEAIDSNYLEWKQDQIKNPNIGLAVYSFATNKKGSDKLWQKFLLIGKEILPYLDERNSVLLAYSFCKKGIKDQGFWKRYETVIIPKYPNFKFINQSTVAYSFSLCKTGSQQLWDIMEKPFLQKDYKTYSKRDIVQILFSFARYEKGSKEFWGHMEQAVLFNQHNFTFTDLNQIAYSFQMNDIGSKEFWDMFKNAKISIQIDNTNNSNQNDLFIIFNELVFFGRIMKKKEVATKELWNSLEKPFIKLINTPNILQKATVPISYHTQFYVTNPEIFTMAVENQYIQFFEWLFKRNVQDILTQIINICYLLTDTKVGSPKIWKVLTDLIINHKDLLADKDVRHVRGFCSSVYILTNLNPYTNEKNVEVFDKFCADNIQYFINDYKCTAIITRCFFKYQNQNKTLKKVFQEIAKSEKIKPDFLFITLLSIIYRYQFQVIEKQFIQFREYFENSIIQYLIDNKSRKQLLQDIEIMVINRNLNDNFDLLQWMQNMSQKYFQNQFVFQKYLEKQCDSSKHKIIHSDEEEQYRMESEEINEKNYAQYFEKQQDFKNPKQF